MKLLIPPPFVALICLVLMWVTASYLPAFSFDFPFRVMLALGLCIIGGAVDLMAVALFIRNKTTVSPVAPQRTDKLVVEGIYRYTRNPMYLGMALLILAIGLWVGNATVFPALALFIWYITTFQIMPEEAALLEKFGSAYEDYCSKVRRWI